MILQEILLIFLLILINSTFAITEMAVVTSRIPRVKTLADGGGLRYKHLLKILDEPGTVLSTIQVGISLIGIFAGAVGGATLGDEAGLFLRSLGLSEALATKLGLVLVVLLTTYVSVVVGELVPKHIALVNPEPIAAVMQYPVRLLAFVFFPLVKLLTGTSGFILALLGIKNKGDKTVTQEELLIMVAESAHAGNLAKLEHRLVSEALLLGDRKITSFMQQRTTVPCIEDTASDDELKAFVLAHAKEDALPMVHESIDRIIAMVDIRKSLFSLANLGYIDRTTCLVAPIFLPGTFNALRTMEILMSRDIQDTAVVLDEFGGVDGIVCLSDILESMVNHELIDPYLTKHSPRLKSHIQLPASLEGQTPIGELMHLVNLPDDLPNKDFETLAGMFLYFVNRMPEAGESIVVGSCRFTVEAMERTRIKRIRVEPINNVDLGGPKA